MKTAIVVGATGLLGSNLIKQLLESTSFKQVKVFTRRSVEINHPQLDEHIVDFDQINSWQYLLTGDVLFSAMGTTLKKAGSKATQYKIDYTYQYDVAMASANNGVKTCCLVSSAGANPNSSVFYSRMKGELDEAVQKLGFKHTFIFRPSILAGDRKENRVGEKIGLVLANIITWIPGLRKYRPIEGNIVAKAMINIAETVEERSSFMIYTLGEIFPLAD